MPEKWENELQRLRGVDRPVGLEDRMREGPRHEPGRPTRERVAAGVVAFAVCIALAVVAVTALRDDGGSTPVTPGPADEDVVVLNLTSNADGPTATVTYGDRVQDAVFEGANWCPEGAPSGQCTSYIADFAFYPPVSEFLVVPPGTPIEITGEGSIATVDVTDPQGEPSQGAGAGASSVPAADGMYVFDVHGTWPQGEGDFFFGIQALSSPAAAPDVLTVDCRSFVARVDTAVVRTQVDGLHVRVLGDVNGIGFGEPGPEGNGEPSAAIVGTDGGPVGLDPGSWGVLCGNEMESGFMAPFELIDPDDHHAPEQLTCTAVETSAFTSSVPTSVGADEAAPQLVTGLGQTDVLRGAGYGADTWHLGWTYVVDREGEAVLRLVLGENGSTWGGQVETCAGSGLALSDAATLVAVAVTGSGPDTPVTGPTGGTGTTGATGATPAPLPVDELVVRCEGLGPAADAVTVTVQTDGVHVSASNIADAAAVVIEGATGEVVSLVAFDEVTESFVVPLEPGTYWFGCRVLDEETGEIDGTHVERPEAYVVFEVVAPTE